MKFSVLTIFPTIITSYCNETILGRGQKNGVIEIRAIDIRDFAEGKHRQVDDTPYGGGAGMVMKPEPIYRALQSIGGLSQKIPNSKSEGITKIKNSVKKFFLGEDKKKRRTILLSPRGRQFDQRIAEEWAQMDELVLVCGRYEGVDERVSQFMVDEEISVGSYVLAGGELGALVIVEAVARLVPGVLGNEASLLDETHNTNLEKEYPQYTKPEVFMELKVPEVLLSGNHKKIEEWRKGNV